MNEIAVSELRVYVNEYIREANEIGPLLIKRYSQILGVLMSYEDYLKLTKGEK